MDVVGGATAVGILPDGTDEKWRLAKEVDVPLSESSLLVQSIVAAVAAEKNAEVGEGEKEAMVSCYCQQQRHLVVVVVVVDFHWILLEVEQ